MPNISVYMMVCVRQLITSQDPGARESTVLLNILGRKPQPDVANCVLRCSSPVHGGTRVQALPAPGRIGVHPVCFRMSGVPPAVRDRAAELAPDGRLIAGGRGPFLLGLAAREVMRQAPGIERRHEFMEVFAGAAGCSQAVRHDGLQAATFDREGPHGHESEDITQLSGLIWAGMLICSVTENGLCWFAPQCSTWTWMSRGTSRRSQEDCIGDESRADVSEANVTAMCMRWAYLPSSA